MSDDPSADLPGEDRPRHRRGASVAKDGDAHRRRAPLLPWVLLTVLVAGLAGGAAGWFAGERSASNATAEESSPGSTAQDTPPASTGEDATGEAGSDPMRSLPALVSSIEESVVSINATVAVAGPPGQAGTSEVAGSGFVYASDGLIATNAHVVEGATSVTVSFSDGRTFDADVVGADTTRDVALLSIDAVDLPTLELATDMSVAVGDFVIVVGNALDLEGSPSVTVGVVSAVDRDIQVEGGSELTGLIQTDAAISSGDSGGPLLTASGAVVGINTAAASSTDTATVQNIGFAIPIADAAPVLEQLADLGG